MDFKQIGINTAVASTIVAGSLLITTSAQALVVGGTPNYNPLNSLPTTLSVSNEFNDGDLSGGFTNVTNLVVDDLQIFSGSSTLGFNANHLAVSNYVTGFEYRGVNAAIDVNAGDKVLHTINNQIPGMNFVSTLEFDFTGIIRAANNPNQILGSVVGGLSANQSVINGITSTSNFSLNLDATPVPTPALLPGLIGMGITAVRKKKQKELA